MTRLRKPKKPKLICRSAPTEFDLVSGMSESLGEYRDCVVKALAIATNHPYSKLTSILLEL